MKINKEQLQVYAVTDRKSVNKKRYATLIDAVEAAIKGGATIVQLREKGAIVAQGDALGTTDKATVVEVRVGKTPVEPLRILRGQCDALRSY